MSHLSNGVLQSARSEWSSAIQTGMPGRAPAFQPTIVPQPAPAIASRLDWLDEEFRQAYMEASVEQNIAWQIKFNRQHRGMDQAKLAAIIGTRQSAISRMEDPSYGRLNIKSLIRIAHAFQCALSIKLIPYSRLAEENRAFDKASAIAQPFNEEARLIRGEHA